MPVPDTDPTELALEAFRAFEAKEWLRVAKLVHPTALAEFHRSQLVFARASQDNSIADAKPSAMPAALASFITALRVENPFLAAFARVSSLRELESLSQEEFLARWGSTECVFASLCFRWVR